MSFELTRPFKTGYKTTTQMEPSLPNATQHWIISDHYKKPHYGGRQNI
jgi:hypothetical protein